ncbi:MAG: hypothetical protein CVV64_11500 [Candidatus Wallbacteria bacterium HGW-Wallbacteria-1]|jgi:Na+-transporting methylmalonyl-CoA/oxaloacetate decarboxylase gamma subunit|uniref:Uncharacterized protein n=1 Tax=Candidatus Wallbacteria bacterium HGW-Wallbacteria-1 TaxID=2013854 RepID=A0A2N1PNU8_9BACT|nr:MAG: hypothetical protein CVV64_11500 [Candidatus Wallbacteria bacterium HGW-Wallbacteria-1]
MILSAAVAATSEATLSQGLTISMVGMGVVFCGLVFLYSVMLLLDATINRVPKRQVTPSASGTSNDPSKEQGSSSGSEPDEVVAAMIGFSLYLYNRKYEEAKEFILTGQKREIPYKPWSMAGRYIEVNRDFVRKANRAPR